jgi:hypothetical protein
LILSVVVVVVVTQKISISRDLGTSATRKPNQLIGFDEKLASVCIKSKETVHKRLIVFLLATPIDSAYSMYNACMHAGHVLSAHAHNYKYVNW